MSFNLRRTLRLALIGLIVAGILGSTAYGQEPSDKAFEAVPMQLRAQLIQRLNEYLKYEKTGQYEKLFDLLYQTKAAATENQTRETYVASRQKTAADSSMLEQFVPTLIVDVTLRDGDPMIYSITGRAKVKSQGPAVEKEMTLFARLENGDWKFSELSDSYMHYNKPTQ